jgi:hypothetical protein
MPYFYCSDLLYEHSLVFLFSIILVVLMFYFQQGGQCELEVVGKKGVVQLNVRPINPGTKVSLTGGDEVIFSSCHSMLMYPTIIS